MSKLKRTTTLEEGEGRALVLKLLLERPGIMSKEIGDKLNLSRAAVGRHIRQIRAAWDAKEKWLTKHNSLKKSPTRKAKIKEAKSKQARLEKEMPNVFETFDGADVLQK